MTTTIPTPEEVRDTLTRRLEHVDQEREQLLTAIAALTPAKRRGRPPKISIDAPAKRRGRPPKAKAEATNGQEPEPIAA